MKVIYDALVFSEDSPELPNDVSKLAESIQCYNAEPYPEYPGFVRLRQLGEMNYIWKCKKYAFSPTTTPNAYTNLNWDSYSSCLDYFIGDKFSTLSRSVTGPAIKCQEDPKDPKDVTRDDVHSLWCPQWPRQAQLWPKRNREYGWPTIDAITEVVHNGCHVVSVQHRAYKNDALMWRYSFSVAEVILLRRWTPVQQIVYHLLRFFSKRELIQKDCPKEDEALCTYHLKTLMLWTCEELPPEWWHLSSVIMICSELLRKLSDWLKKRHCPNYFIPEANLFHDPLSSTVLDVIEKRLNIFHDSSKLCQWFLGNYLGLPPIIYECKNAIEVKRRLVGGLRSLIELRKVNTSKNLDRLFSSGYTDCYYSTCGMIKLEFQSGLTFSFLHSCFSRIFLSFLRKPFLSLPTTEADWCFTNYDATLFSLHIATGLRSEEISWDSELFVEFVKTGIFLKPKIVRSQYHIFPKPFSAEISQCNFLQAQDLLENLTGINNPSECHLLSIMSQQFLKKALLSDDSQSNCIAPAALVYLAAIQFALSEFHIVADLCSEVLMDHTTCVENETLNAGCLFFIDDVIRIVGFCLLWKKVRENAKIRKKQIYLDLRLTPEVFAHYLAITSAERIYKELELTLDFPTSAVPLDEIFVFLANRKYRHTVRCCICLKTERHYMCRRTDSVPSKATLPEHNSDIKEEISNALTERALENLTSFYDVIRKDFGIQCNTADCYRALYLYKCRRYADSLNLCERILEELDLENSLQQFAFPNVLVLPPLDSFYDSDVQCLLGFHTLSFYLLSLDVDLCQFDLTPQPTFAQYFARITISRKDQLSTSLVCPYYVKRHYFLGGHFLAKYLKVRCCIDCNLPLAEAIAEFTATKINLPFEHIIRRFLLQKYRRFQI